MKLFLPIFLVCALAVNAQNTNPDTLSAKVLKLKVNKIAPSSVQLPFGKIKIVDNRFDTTKLGFVPNFQIIRNKKRIARKLTMEGGVSRALEHYYNGYYENSFGDTSLTLLIVLKKLWLSGIDDESNKELDISENMYAARFLYCKLEYYFCKNGFYYPFKRLDTTVNGISFETDNNASNNFSKNTFKLVFSGLIEVIDYNTPVNKISKLQAKTEQEFLSFNGRYFNMPVLKDTSIVKGVFLNFNEFKNNQPSILKFKERTIKMPNGFKENYLEDEQGSRIVNYWGYYTGTDLKIGKFGNEKLYRKNNTFEFFVTTQNTYLTKFLTYSQAGNYEFWIPYQVDMETGNIY